MSGSAARAMLIAAAEFGEATIQTFARRVLEVWGEGPEGDDIEGADASPERAPLSQAERCRRWRQKRRERHEDRHEKVSGRHESDTRSDTKKCRGDTEKVSRRVALRVAPRARTCDLDLSLIPSEIQDLPGSLQLEGGAGETVGALPSDTASDTDATRNDTTRDTRATRPTRKKPTTHCPAPEEGTEALDTWCRSHRIPPASKVAEVARMVGWHQSNGVPRASWLATWQQWQRSPYRNEQPSGTRRAVPETVDPIEEQRKARARNAEADRKVREAFERNGGHAAYERDEREREQQRKARIASTRPPSEPVPVGATKAARRELTAEELEAKKRDDLARLAAMQADEARKAAQ